jgi:hypothetical protein
VEGSCEHSNEPSVFIKFGKFLSGCATGGFSRRAQLHGVSYLTITNMGTFEVIFNKMNIDKAYNFLQK